MPPKIKVIDEKIRAGSLPKKFKKCLLIFIRKYVLRKLARDQLLLKNFLAIFTGKNSEQIVHM